MISGFYEMKQHEACLGLEEQGRRWWSQSWGYQEIGAQGDVSTPREATQRGGHTLAPPSTLRFPVGLPSAKPRLEPDGKVTQQMACAGITRESRNMVSESTQDNRPYLMAGKYRIPRLSQA